MTGGGPMPGSGCSTVEKRKRERYQVGGSNSCYRELGLSTLFRNFFGDNRCANKQRIIMGLNLPNQGSKKELCAEAHRGPVLYIVHAHVDICNHIPG